MLSVCSSCLFPRDLSGKQEIISLVFFTRQSGEQRKWKTIVNQSNSVVLKNVIQRLIAHCLRNVRIFGTFGVCQTKPNIWTLPKWCAMSWRLVPSLIWRDRHVLPVQQDWKNKERHLLFAHLFPISKQAWRFLEAFL